MTTEEDSKYIPIYMKFAMGGVSGMIGTTLVHPVDLIKTHMQIAGMQGTESQGVFDWIRGVFKKYGARAFYRGLTAGWLRQAVYASTRLGIYQVQVVAYKKEHNKDPRIRDSILMACIAGVSAGIVGTPTEVTLLNMTADNNRPNEERKKYKCATEAMRRIANEKGVLALWRGTGPSVTKAVVLNVSQLATYSQLKILFRDKYGMPKGLPMFLYASIISAIFSSFVTLPVDLLKTRMQVPRGNKYRSAFDVCSQTIKTEGVLSLWKGIVPFCIRSAPHTAVSLIILEQLRIAYYKHVLEKEFYSGL